ncbi:hypothetical protein ACH5RR_007240 [Cinchona calisaya]|uniref:Phorbol-ester/DAG-type domain-containing protein n=1 Tax=Cinchona calisaya TaxID=153742 RepID=A0ABD3ARP7_9GENT
MEEYFQHFSHGHPLIFNEGKKDKTEEEKIHICKLCSQPIILGSSFYSCQEHCEYSLHKPCAELPFELEHKKHPHHTLVLYSNHTHHPPNKRASISDDPYYYRCNQCFFDLDIISASPTDITTQHGSHNMHLLILMRRPASLLCDACGETQKGYFYMCNSCSFYIHQDCASSPKTIKHSDHDHHLTLSYSLPVGFSPFDAWLCLICRKRLGEHFWIYYCRRCRFFAHLKCAMSMTEPFMSILRPRISRWADDSKLSEDVKMNVIRLPPANEFVSNVGHLLLTSTKEEKGLKGLIETNHLMGHQNHQLILVNESTRKDIVEYFLRDGNNNSPISNVPNCYVCSRSISPPFYCCKICNLFFHDKCTKLPSEIRHPCHPDHPLILHPYAPDYFFGWFMCDLCFRQSTGICFHCPICRVSLDVNCAMLPRTVIHEAHPHHLLVLRETPLTLFLPSYYCHCCKSEMYKFGYLCTDCDFGLHSCCALYPSTTSHKYDKHDLKLICDPSQGNSDEYYCEICELQIDQRKWFYHCVECDNSFHIGCDLPREDKRFRLSAFSSLENHSNLKFGIPLTSDSHPHALTFVGHLEGSKCTFCDWPINADDYRAFECLECNIIVHFNCCEKYLEREKAKCVSITQEESEKIEGG